MLRRSAVSSTYPFARRLRHDFFHEFIVAAFGGMWGWRYWRFKQTDEYFEVLPDLLGIYCMGGEL